jgi:RND family efflux transporter MFP subunit
MWNSRVETRPACWRTLFVLCGLGIVVVLAAGCNNAVSAPPELPPPQVTVAEVVQRETLDYDEYVGRTEASETVEVRARVYGYLKTVEFKDGDYVAVDQPLFTIEPDEYDAIHKQSLARIEVAESKANLAHTKLARNEKLVKGGSVSKEEYDESVAAVRESEAAILAAKADAARTALDLKYTVIRSPIAGRIDRAFVTPGNLLTGGLTNGTLLTRIVKVEPIYVYFDIDERSLLRYQKLYNGKADASPQTTIRERGIPIFLQLADEQDFPHEGKLDFAENRVDPGTGTITIRGVFANENRLLTPGLFVRVRVPIGEKYEALLIPEQAIASDQGTKYVYVVDGANQPIRRDVQLGSQQGSLRAVKSGLQAGERVIVKGLQRVRVGQKVEPIVAQPAAKQ